MDVGQFIATKPSHVWDDRSRGDLLNLHHIFTIILLLIYHLPFIFTIHRCPLPLRKLSSHLVYQYYFIFLILRKNVCFTFPLSYFP